MFSAESKIPAFGRDKRRSFLPSVKKSVSSADFEDQGGAAPNSASFIHSPAPPSLGHAHSTHSHAHSTHGHAHSTQQGHAHSTQQSHAHSTQQSHAHSTQQSHAYFTQQGHAPLQHAHAHPTVPLGGRVCISGVKFGTLLYFGETHITGGLWCGIELDDPDGKHDGEVEGRRYFRCRPLHGIFAPVEKVQAVPQDPRHQQQHPFGVAAPGFEGGLPHGGGSGGIAPGKRAFVGGSKEPSEKIANLTFVKDAPLCSSTPERAGVGSYKELSGKYKDAASAHAADDDCSVRQDLRRVAREGGEQTAAAATRDRDERCDQTAAQQSGGSSGRFRGIPKLGGGAAAAGIPKLRQAERELPAPPRPAADRDQEAAVEVERAPPQPRQSGLPVASRLPKFGRPSKGGASSPGGGEPVSPRDLSKTFSLGPLEDTAATQEGSGSSVEESDPLSPDVKKNLKSDSRQYLNLTFDAENRSSPSNQSQNLPDVVSSVSSSPDSRASLSDSKDSESALRLSLSAGGTNHLTSSSLPDPMTSSGGQEFSSDLDHSDLMEGYEIDDEFAEPTPLGQYQVVRTDMTSLPVEGVVGPELRKTQQGFSMARDVTQPDSQDLGDGLDRTYEYEEEDGGALQQGGLTRAFSSGTEPDSSSTLFGSSCALAHSSTDAALCDSGSLPEESEAQLGGRRGGGGDDTFLVPEGVQEVEPPLEQFAEVDKVDAMSDSSMTTATTADSGGGAVKLRTSGGGGNARRRGPMTDSGISEQGDLDGAELGGRPDVILQAQGDDGQLAEDLRAGHARCDRPVSLLSTTSADTGYVADGDSECGTLTANSPLDWNERGVAARPPPREQAPRPPRLPGDGDSMQQQQQQQQTKAASPVNEGVTEDDRTEADRDITEAGEKGKASRELTTTMTAAGQPCPALVSSTGAVMASSATESMIASDPALLLQPGRQDAKTAAGSEEEKVSARTEDDDDNEAVVKDGAAEDEEGDVEKPDEHDDEGDDHGEEEEEGEEAKRRKSMSDSVETPGSPASRASGRKGAGVRKGSMPVTKRPMPNTKAAASKLADYIKAPPPTPRPKEDRAEEAKNKKNVANKHRASTAKGDADTSSAGDVSSVEGGRRASRVKVEKEVPKIVKRAPVKNKWEDIMSQIEANKDQAKPKPKAEVKSTLAAYLSAPAPPPRKEREPKKESKPRSVLQHKPTPDYSKVKSKLSSTLPPPPPPRAQSPPASSRRMSQGGSKPGAGQREGVLLDLSSNLSSARSSRSDLSGAGDSSLNNSGRRTERASRNSISKGPAHLKNERSTSVASTRSDTSQAGTSVKAMNARNSQKSETARTEPPPPKPKKSAVKSSIPPPDQNRSRTVATKSARPTTTSSSSAAPSTSNHVKSAAPDLVSTARSARGQEVARLEALCETRTKELTLAKLQLKQQTLGLDAMGVVVRYLNEQLDGFSCPLVTEKLKEAEKGLEAFREKTEALTRRREELEAELKELQAKHQAAASEAERLSGELTAAKEAHDKSATEQQASHETQLSAQREHLLACHKEELLRVQERHERELNHLKKAHERNLGDLKLENQIATDNLRLKHLEDIEALRSKHDAQMEELHKQHRDKLEDITKRFESIKTTLGEKVETLRGECDELRNRAKMSEDALLRDADVKVQMALEPYRHLPKEIESLKTVIEMRNDEIQKLRTKNMDLDKQLEELPIAREKIISLQQKVENLEAIVNIKSDHEKQLHEKCGNLMRKYDRESKANKRLSMDYEELMWRMSQSSELDLGSQESLNYRRQISRSPPGSESGSPTLVRRHLSSPAPPNNGDQSPRYNRRSTPSASGENSLERRLKRRSQTFVLEEKPAGGSSASASASPSHSPQPKRLSPQGLKGESPPPSLTVSYPGPSCQEPLPSQGGAGSDPESDVFEQSREVSVCLSLPNGNQQQQQQQQQQEEEEEEVSVSVVAGKDQHSEQHHHSDQLQQKQQPPKSGRSVVESDV